MANQSHQKVEPPGPSAAQAGSLRFDLDASAATDNHAAPPRATDTEAVELISHFNASGNLAFVNAVHCRFFGKQPSELIGTPWRQIVLADDLPRVEQSWQQVSPANPMTILEIRVHADRGVVRWVRFFARATFDSTGQLLRAELAGREIHDRQQTAQEMQESAQRFGLAFQASSIGMVLIGLDGRILQINDAFASMLGYRPDEMIGRVNLQITHRDDRAITTEHLLALASGEKPVVAFEKRYVTREGRTVWGRVTATVVQSAQGEPVFSLAQIEDITAVRAAQESLARYQEQLERLVEERSRALEESRQNSAFARAVLDSVPAQIAVLDWNGVIVSVNAAWRDFAAKNADPGGVSAPVGPGGNYLDTCDYAAAQGCEDARRAAQGIRALIAGQSDRFLMEYSCHAPQEERWFLLSATPFRHHGGRVVVVHTNISERRRMEQALRNSEERTRAIVNTAAEAIVTIDRLGTILDVNAATTSMFGYASAELVGRNVSLLMPAPFRQEHDGYLERYLRTGEKRIIGMRREIVAKRKDGSVFPADLAVSEVRHLGIFTGILRDTTDRRELQRHVLEIAAAEQRRIGQELHDGTGQELTGISLFAAALGDVIAALPKTTRKGKTARLVDQSTLRKLKRTITTLRHKLNETKLHVSQLSRGLMPVQIDAEGLRSALEGLAASTNASRGIACRFICPAPVMVANNVTAMHLYRIAQEAVNNAVRHSRGNQIQISLVSENDQIVLEVSDNGVGIDRVGAKRASRPGMGLRTMEYRCGIIGGTLTIDSSAVGGTIVRCALPAALIPTELGTTDSPAPTADN